MPSTRRRFVASSTALLVGAAGCSDRLEDTTLQEVHLQVSKATDAPLTFHFVLDAEDGIGEWHDVGVDAGADRTAVVEPAADRAWTGYHAVAGDHRVAGTLLGEGEDNACLQLDFRVDADGISGWLPSDQRLCRTPDGES